MRKEWSVGVLENSCFVKILIANCSKNFLRNFGFNNISLVNMEFYWKINSFAERFLILKHQKHWGYLFMFYVLDFPEAPLQRCSYKKVLWKYATNLQENTHAEVWLQISFLYEHLRRASSDF